jgi:hypothetical protein
MRWRGRSRRSSSAVREPGPRTHRLSCDLAPASRPLAEMKRSCNPIRIDEGVFQAQDRRHQQAVPKHPKPGVVR